MCILQLKGIHHNFDHRPILRNISIQVERGQFIALLGPSGCGKTTLLRIIAGLTKPQSGHIIIEGIDQTKVPPNKRNIGFVFQTPRAIFQHLNVYDNVAFAFRRGNRQSPYGKDWSKSVNEILDLTGLSNFANNSVNTLSGGELQRVAIARALVYRPSLLLLDEPLSSLDNFRKDSLLELMHDLHRNLGITFLYVTHDDREVIRVATHVAILDNAHLHQFDTVHKVISQPHTTTVAKLIGGWNIIRADHFKIFLEKKGIVYDQNFLKVQPGSHVGIPITKTIFSNHNSTQTSNKVIFPATVIHNTSWYNTSTIFCETESSLCFRCHTNLKDMPDLEQSGFISFSEGDINVFSI
ncbi:Spermidine/putrescine import ATP-binding protein PotA [Gimesia alba]|uniref:Spermidine/putrescine import ATP-binding protein PotA n=1 Tax=Gimesia alba TaxID=2527973 RepID=A0A517RHX2_9PLAN|nr:ABC transporter ATP-binding protein [Gimesia alba]QDT43473.1 Spermidine/putrescine import ATP-binding protein PotA [Gimesia alba]